MKYFLFLSCLLVLSLQLEAQNTIFSENSCPRIYIEPGAELVKLYPEEQSNHLNFFELYQGDTLTLAWEVDGKIKEFRFEGLYELVESYTTIDSIYLYDITRDDQYDAFVFFNTTLSRDGWSSGWYESFDFLHIWDLSSLEHLEESEIELGTEYDTWGLSSLPPEDLTDEEFDFFIDTVAYDYDSLLYKCELDFHFNTFQVYTKLIYDSYGDEDETSNLIRFRYENGSLKEE